MGRMPVIITPREKKLVLRNFLSLTTLQGLGYLLPLLVIPYLIRTIGLEKFGLIAFAQAFVQYFMILTDYGFSITATRNIALCSASKEKTCAIFSSVMTVKTILSAASFIVLAGIIHLVPKFNQDWPVYLLSFGSVIGNSLFPVWFFQGKEKMTYIASVNAVGGVFFAASIFIFVRNPADYLHVPALTSIFFLVTGIAGFYIAFRKFGLEFIVQTYSDVQKEFKAGWSIFVSVVAINAYTTSRVFAVGLLTNNTVTAYYAVAERIAGIIQAFPLDSLSKALYPRLNAIFSRNKKRAQALMLKAQRSTTRTFIIAVPVLFAVAPFLVGVMCGRRDEEAIIALRLLLVGVLCAGANAFRVQFLLVCGKSDLYARLHIIAALVGVPLLFVLIHFFSYCGAALASIIIEAGIFLTCVFIVQRIMENRGLHDNRGLA
jgi:PST family polysaccharide transporter